MKRCGIVLNRDGKGMENQRDEMEMKCWEVRRKSVVIQRYGNDMTRIDMETIETLGCGNAMKKSAMEKYGIATSGYGLAKL